MAGESSSLNCTAASNSNSTAPGGAGRKSSKLNGLGSCAGGGNKRPKSQSYGSQESLSSANGRNARADGGGGGGSSGGGRMNGGGGRGTVPQPVYGAGGLRVHKVVILGDGGVGKSAVTLQYVRHSFPEYHDPTIEDSYQQQAVIDGEAVVLDILDTAGQVEFTSMRDQYMRCGEGFIICYSVTDRHSFHEAAEYRQLISRCRLHDDIPLVLVANKLDLGAQRKVSTEEGQTLAAQLGCPFYETSAALRTLIDDAFHAVIREIRRKEHSRRQRSGSTSTDKLHRSGAGGGRSRWWRLRSILAMVFRRPRRHQN